MKTILSKLSPKGLLLSQWTRSYSSFTHRRAQLLLYSQEDEVAESGMLRSRILSSAVKAISTSRPHGKIQTSIILQAHARGFHQSKSKLVYDQQEGQIHVHSKTEGQNPLDSLQPMLEVPILQENDFGFQPSPEEVHQGSHFFKDFNIEGEPFQFLGSWPNPHIMPQWDLPEVAFIGRSNIGKSSLLSAMFAEVPQLQVRTSKKPGHTKLMNVFNVKNKFHLVDMPGYGFNMPKHFETSVEAYIQSRRNKMTMFLIDGSVGMTTADRRYFQKYSDLNVPLTIVMTKIDKARPAKLLRSLLSVLKFKEEAEASSCFPQPFLVSSKTGDGVAFLMAFVAHITGNLAIGSHSS